AGEGDPGAAGCAGQLYPAAQAGSGQAVFDAGGGRVQHHGAGDGGDGADRAGGDQGGRRGGLGGVWGDQEDGGDGGGDVPQAAGPGGGGGQRGAAAAGDREERDRAGDGAGEDGEYHAAPAFRGRGVRVDQGGGGSAHAVLQG